MGKTLSEDGIEYVDGEAVMLYDARFSNTFMMENEDAAPVASGDLVTFMITARAADPTFKHLKTGELKRLNPFKIEEAYCFGVDGEDVLQVLLDALQKHKADRTADEILNGTPAKAVSMDVEGFSDSLFIDDEPVHSAAPRELTALSADPETGEVTEKPVTWTSMREVYAPEEELV